MKTFRVIFMNEEAEKFAEFIEARTKEEARKEALNISNEMNYGILGIVEYK